MSEYVTVAKVADVPAGEARIVEANGRSIALCHVAGDRIYAIDNVCTHDSGPLGDGTLRGEEIECPRHGALFDVKSGAAQTLPAVRGVRAYDVRVVDDDVQIALEDAQ